MFTAVKMPKKQPRFPRKSQEGVARATLAATGASGDRPRRGAGPSQGTPEAGTSQDSTGDPPDLQRLTEAPFGQAAIQQLLTATSQITGQLADLGARYESLQS